MCLLPHCLYVFHHLCRRPVSVSIVAVQPALSAEVADVWATAGVLDDVGPIEDVFLRVQQVPARRRHPRQARHGVSAVELLEPARCGIPEHSGKDFFSLADTDGIGVFSDLIRVERGMRATHEDGDSPTPEVSRDLIPAQRCDCPDGNRHDVHVGIEIDFFCRVIDQRYLPVLRCERGQVGNDCTHQFPLPQFVRFEQASKAIARCLRDEKSWHYETLTYADRLNLRLCGQSRERV